MTDNKKTANDIAKTAGAKIINQKAPAASGFSVPERIWNFLTQEKGVSSIVTAAIMGNIFQESTYNPNAYNDDEMKAGRASNAAVGICQWLEGRHTALDKVAAAKGKQWNELEAQLEHLWNEIGPGGYYNQFLNHMTKTYTQESQLDEAVEYWEKHFEVSGDVNSYPRRKAAAKEALQKQGKGIIAGGTYSPGASPANGFMGQSSAAKRGTVVKRRDVEQVGHANEFEVKPLDPDKTFCEPIYPDLTSIGEEIPAYSVPNMPTSEMKSVDYDAVGAGLVYEASTSRIVKFAGDKNLENYVVKNEAIASQRREIFNKAKNRNAFKKPSAGKPPNNLDPFPVDHKIVELETHQPRCKIEQVYACHHSIDVAKALVLLSTDTEKRLVKIENNMATMMRYLYRMAARVNINCVYYGGQIPVAYPAKGPNGENNKYCCIRCLKDDRIQEGKQVSLDQCLNCTRYEPLIGQVYDILTDTGDNLSAILDDNQMSYTTMDEYYKFRNLSERQTPMQSAKTLDAASVQNRNVSEINFDDEWGPGLAMDWSLYPVEMQRPHTNPQVEGVLASSFGMNNGMAITNGGVMANMLIEARNQIDASDSKAKQAGSEYALTKADSVAAEVKAKLGSQIREYYQSKSISSGQDTCLIASLMSVYGGQVGDTVDKIEKVKSDLKGRSADNIVLSVMFYALDQKYLFGEGADDKLPMRLDKIPKTENGSNANDDNQNNANPVSNTIMPTGAWDNVTKWNWNDISEALTVNISGKYDINSLPEQMINFAKVVYLYKELLSKCSASRFDTAEWGFPFTEEQITGGLGLNFSSGFKWRWNRQHWGIDIGVGTGADSYKDGGNDSQIKAVPIHAARDGIVYDIATFADNNGGGQQVYLQHDGGYTSWYMHLSGFAVKKGDKVNRGDIIGYTGGSGAGNSMLAYPEHLHFEIHQGGDAASHAYRKDPLTFYNGITMANEGSQLSAITV